MVGFKYRDTIFSYAQSGIPAFAVYKSKYAWSALADERMYGPRFSGYKLLCRKGLEKW